MNLHDRYMWIGPARRRRVILGWLIAVLLSWTWALPVLAQSGRVLIDDPERLFGDRSAVRDAAQRLAAEGADVIVVAVQDAGVGSEAGRDYLDSRLRRLGVADGLNRVGGNQIVFFVTPQPGYDAIVLASRYRAKLDPVLQQIRLEQMRPRFQRNDFSGGMVAGIDAVRTTLNPPTSPVVWVAGGAVAAAAAGAAVAPALRKRRAASEALAAARKRMEEARSAAGVAIADLGQRVEAAQEKAQYDRVSYAPADAERITERQRYGESLFARAQAAFDEAEEAHIALARPAAADYDRLAATYRDAERLATEAALPIEEAERIRAALDSGVSPSTGATRRLQ